MGILVFIADLYFLVKSPSVVDPDKKKTVRIGLKAKMQ